MRAGELLGLMWRDWQAGVLVVSRSLDRITGMLKVPKGRRARRVPIHPDAFEVLERRMSTRSTTMIFNIGYDAWRNQVTRALRGIGVEEGSTHLLRHTCASWWVQDGGSLMALQRLLGHATLDMTLIYAHLAPDSVEQEAAKMWGPLGTSPSSPKGIKTPSKGSERTA
jgi:integrase